MKNPKRRHRPATRWSHRTKRGLFLLGLLITFGLAGLVVVAG